MMVSRGGGGLQGLLEHAAREYKRVDTATGGPEVQEDLRRFIDRPAFSPTSTGSAHLEEQSADRTASNPSRGSSPRDAGMPSRKRQRVDSGPHGVSPLSPSTAGLKSQFSEDGGASAGENYGAEAVACAGKDGAGTNRFPFECLLTGKIAFVSWGRYFVTVKLYVHQFGEPGEAARGGLSSSSFWFSN